MKKERATKSASTPWVVPLRAMLLASTLSIAATPASPQSLIGGGFSPTDDPDSPYYLGEVAPPSWQGRPYAISEDGALTFLLSRRTRELGLLRIQE